LKVVKVKMAEDGLEWWAGVDWRLGKRDMGVEEETKSKKV